MTESLVQVVTELQSRLHSRSDDSCSDQQSHTVLTRLASSPRHSPREDATSPSSPPDGRSAGSSSSVSSYDNTEHSGSSQQATPTSVQSASGSSTRELMSPATPTSIEARFDSVLKMMNDLTEDVKGTAAESATGRSEYAMPFKKPSGDHRGPAVAPKPNRELYESLLSNNSVGPYLVSPIVHVSG